MRSRRRMAVAVAVVVVAVRAGAVGADIVPFTTEPSSAVPSSRAKPELDKAREAFQRKDVEQAYKHLQEAVKKDPDLFPARVLLAQLFLVNNHLDQGRAVLEQAVK